MFDILSLVMRFGEGVSGVCERKNSFIGLVLECVLITLRLFDVDACF